MIATSDQEMQDVISLNRLDELIEPAKKDWVVQMDAITISAVRMRRRPEVLREEVVQQTRIERVKQAQKVESWNTIMKKI